MASLLWPDDSCRDGSEGLAARRPAMTRPLIERRDLIAAVLKLGDGDEVL